jgi:putative membrane protein insertion efficiency factor
MREENFLDSGGLGLFKNILVFIIVLYQKYISPLKKPSCRFYPTCSQYAVNAIERYGGFKGSFMAIKRIIKCHPFHPGGYDPVK